MPLFVNDADFIQWGDNPAPTHFLIPLQVILTNPGKDPNPENFQTWFLDTAFDGELLCWPYQLVQAGIRYEVNFPCGSVTPTFSEESVLQRWCGGDLYLVSNSGENPFLLPSNGFFFTDQVIRDSEGKEECNPNPRIYRAVIGMRLLAKTELDFRIHFGTKKLSIWTP